jgi:AcrR family transcriptional regulator
VPEGAPTIHPPRQERSRASFERVLVAGAKLLEERGYESFTLAEVSRRAKVSIGSIYGRVRSKDDLIQAIHARAMAQLAAEQREAIAATGSGRLTTAELVAEAVREFAAPIRKHARLLSVFMHRGAVDEEIAAAGSASSREAGRRFEELVLARRDEIVHPDPERAVDVAFRMTYCTLARQIMYGPTFESERAIAWDDLVDELAIACASYLLGTSARDLQALRTRRATAAARAPT